MTAVPKKRTSALDMLSLTLINRSDRRLMNMAQSSRN
jgi:hypothetical protein